MERTEICIGLQECIKEIDGNFLDIETKVTLLIGAITAVKSYKDKVQNLLKKMLIMIKEFYEKIKLPKNLDLL